MPGICSESLGTSGVSRIRARILKILKGQFVIVGTTILEAGGQCCVLASRPCGCNRHPLSYFCGKCVDGGRSSPSTLSRRFYKQRLSWSLEPAVGLCGRVSIRGLSISLSCVLRVLCSVIKVLLII